MAYFNLKSNKDEPIFFVDSFGHLYSKDSKKRNRIVLGIENTPSVFNKTYHNLTPILGDRLL